jgi:hypothetical protein
MSVTPAVAQDRARQRPGSGGSFPPPPGTHAEQLTLNAPVTPARVLPRQLLYESAHLIRDWRTSGTSRSG